MSGAAVILISSRRQRRMVRAYLDAGATEPLAACRPEDLGVRRSCRFNRMMDRGVFVPMADGRCFLDLDAADRYFHNRRWRIILVALVMMLLFLITTLAA